MQAFRYESSPDPIRPDLAEAYRGAWEHIASPGTWLDGATRVAVADATRRARDCALCQRRREALSLVAVKGEHDGAGALAPPLLDAIHRITTNAARLGEPWLRGLFEQGLTAEEYVEALGVAVQTLSIDRFHHALGLPPEPLPEPRPGTPSRVRPEGLVEGEAWVPLQDARRFASELGLPVGRAPYVIRALSLVPDEVRAWQRLSAVQYLAPAQMLRFGASGARALDRSQIELMAGRVSALNECFY